MNNTPSPVTVAAFAGMRKVAGRVDVLNQQAKARAARRAGGYRGPLTRAEAAAEAATQ